MTSSRRRRRDVRQLVVVDVRRRLVGGLVPDARRAEVVRDDAVSGFVPVSVDVKK